MAIGTVGRFAMGPAVKGLMNFLSPGKLSKLDAALRFGPDIGFGVMAGAQTPGDLGDKLIAGLSTATPSLLGGLTASGAVRHLGKGRMAANDLDKLIGGADLIGSVAGDLVGFPAGQQALRVKDSLTGGAGETPFEKLGRQQQEEFANQLLSQYGIVPGVRSDNYLAQLGLA